MTLQNPDLCSVQEFTGHLIGIEPWWEDSAEPYLKLQLPQVENDFQKRREFIHNAGIEEISPAKPIFSSGILNIWQQLQKHPHNFSLPKDKSIKHENEFKEQLLVITAILSQVTENDRKTIYYFDDEVDGFISYEDYISSVERTEEYFKIKARSMQKAAEELKGRLLTTFRAELAVLEIGAALDTEKKTGLDALLVSITPKYLQCPIIQKRLFEAKMLLRSDNSDSVPHKDYIKSISKALNWNQAKNKDRQASYWGVRWLYDAIVDAVTDFQRNSSLSQEQFDRFCDKHCLIQKSLDEVRNTEMTPSAIAVDLILHSSGEGKSKEQYNEGKHGKKVLASDVKAKLPTLPAGFRVKHEKTLETILSTTRRLSVGFEGFLFTPHIRIFESLDFADMPLDPFKEELNYSENLWKAWDLLEKIKFKNQ